MHNEANDDKLEEIFRNHRDEGHIRDLDKDDDNVISDQDAEKIEKGNFSLAQAAQKIIEDAEREIQTEKDRIKEIEKDIEEAKKELEDGLKTPEKQEQAIQKIKDSEIEIAKHKSIIGDIQRGTQRDLQSIDRDGVLKSMGIDYVKEPEIEQEEKTPQSKEEANDFPTRPEEHELPEEHRLPGQVNGNS